MGSYKSNYKVIDWSKGPKYVEKMRIYHGPKDQKGVVYVKDIEPYQNVVNGGWITSRSQHRAFLREHDLIEVGNEKIRPKKPEPMPDARIIMSQIYDKLANR